MVDISKGSSLLIKLRPDLIQSPGILSETLIVSALIFGSMIHFDLTFLNDARV